MGKTKIPWAEYVWNPFAGCSPVSEGCRNCYADGLHTQRHEAFLNGKIVPKQYEKPFSKIQFLKQRLEEPLHWKKPRTVFVNSMSDLFHEDVQEEWIIEILKVIEQCPQHIFMVLTKRPERMRKLFKDVRDHFEPWPLPNLWLGVSVEDQKSANKRIPDLLRTPAVKRFSSCEPLLGPVDLTWVNYDDVTLINSLTSYHGFPTPHQKGTLKLDWVICGGESGQNARPMHPDWVRSVRDQCQEAGTPFFFKQWGEWIVPFDGERACRVCGCTDQWACLGIFDACYWIEEDLCSHCVGKPEPVGDRAVKYFRAGKKAAGNILDGRVWEEYPEINREAYE